MITIFRIFDEKLRASKHSKLVLIESRDLLPVVSAAMSETATSIFPLKKLVIFFKFRELF